MTTHVYETISAHSGEKPYFFDFKQSMKDAPLAKHPETGQTIRRVVLGEFGALSSKPASGNSGSACGPSCGCH